MKSTPPGFSLRLLILLGMLAIAASSRAAVPRDFAVDLKATVSDTAPYIVLSWTQRLQSNISAQKIHRRLKGGTTWVLQSTLSTTQTSYTDATAAPGVEYEYWMERTFTGLFPGTAMGYLSAGVQVPFVEGRGKLLLVIDNTMVAPLVAEIAQLQQDLAGDGWTVQTLTATRSETTPFNTKALIQAAYNVDPANVKMVYLLGHVPVPYSGQLAPDGHSDHVGAWPADGYYGDLDGTWTDTSVNSTAASRTQNDNIPGDGKFDQSTLPSRLELMVGRVDLSGMTRAPSTAASETVLLRRYLRKAHEFRHKLGAYANVPRRTLIRDGFGHAFTSEPFAVTGFAQAFSSVGPTIDEAPSGQWFFPAYAGGTTYLVGHGCGGGSYESAGSVGNSNDFGRKASKVVFTSLFGSYHGDWDAANNFMRAPLAGTATGDSLGLICFWAGRPNWFMHDMGLGETAGYATWLSQNAGLSGGGGYVPGGSSLSGVHVGLVGDPALRLHAVEPPRNLAAQSSGGQVFLKWSASTETGLLGYHVYRSTAAGGPFTRLTAAPQAAVSYTDATATAGQSYSYLVRTLKLESVPGGSYQNLSQASAIAITASSAVTPEPFNPGSLAAAQVGTGVQLTWVDSSTNETGFRIERKVGGAGAFAGIGSVGVGATTFTDPGSFTQGNVYFYRVVATGSTRDSSPSVEASFEAVAGHFDLSVNTMRVNKTAGTATLSVNRFGGATGAVSVNYATANSSAIAGVYYTATSGTLTWANGEQGAKTVAVPITNTGPPQLPRQFKVTLSSPTGGAGIGTAANTAVLIEDPTATLSPGWTQVMLGSSTFATAAFGAEDAIGDASIGGSGVASAATAEVGRFAYQNRTGDGVMTACVPSPVPAQSGARFALMIRETPTSASAMAAAVTSGDPTGFGAKLVWRTTTSGGAAELPSVANNYSTPRWLRLTRAGNVFTAEASAEGADWILLGSATVTLPATACWGLFHFSTDLATSTTNLGDYQLGTFQNIAFASLPAPAAPGNFALTVTGATSVNLTWTPPTTAAGYFIERRSETGAFAQIAALTSGSQASYPDLTASADSAYEYRIYATNGSGDGPWSVVLRAITPLSGSTQSPTRPSFLTAGQGAGAAIALQWTDNSSNETGFELERRSLNGTFALVQAPSANATGATDTSTLPGVSYEYRLRATGAPGNSSWTPVAAMSAGGTATPYQQWLLACGLPMDGSGAGAAAATSTGDGVGNLLKFALGLNPAVPGNSGRVVQSTVTIGSSKYLAITYTQPEPARAGVALVVETCSDLVSWNSGGTVVVSNAVAGGQRTITVRDGTPMTSGAPGRFIRLNAVLAP